MKRGYSTERAAVWFLGHNSIQIFACVCDAVFPSLKENLKLRHCFFRSAFRKSPSISAEGYGCRIPYAGPEDDGTAVYSGRNLILGIPVPINEFGNFHIPWFE